jgi:L-alanine-DL-glutamate epimerase-like enolase superfamily enzyme
MRETVRVESVQASALRIPTDQPESDGTLSWDATTLVLVKARGGGQEGLGYTYADPGTRDVINGKLAGVVTGLDAFATAAAWTAMRRTVRNLGQQGSSAMAISAVDVALWDLKARLLGVPLARLMEGAREDVSVYGSGGFTSYDIATLQAQLGGWAEQGIRMVKMKVGRAPELDPERVRAARSAIGDQVALFVDGNGAYRRKQALAMAAQFAEQGVTWFEEPVSSEDLPGLRLVRGRAPAPMEVAAGEYGYDIPYFERMVAAGAVDVLQADATRCGGYTGFLRAAAICDAHSLPLSAHCAPALHLPVCCAAPRVIHIEYFHDHTRIESMIFDGAPRPRGGRLAPDLNRPGLGLELRRADAERFAV